MWNTRFVILARAVMVTTALTVGLAAPAPLWALGQLENPHSGSSCSGIGVISGWVCNASQVDIILDEGAPLAAAYGTSREDTASACGDADNGFGLLFNWNTLGDGVHTLRALADDVQFASAAFTVTTLWGAEFLPGVSGSYWVEGFPYPFTDVLIHWEESSQNFVIERILPNGNGPNVGGVGFSHEESLPNF